MNRTLTMPEARRDTVEYADMDVPAMMDYIRHPPIMNTGSHKKPGGAVKRLLPRLLFSSYSQRG